MAIPFLAQVTVFVPVQKSRSSREVRLGRPRREVCLDRPCGEVRLGQSQRKVSLDQSGGEVRTNRFRGQVRSLAIRIGRVGT
nr:hypothetical protein Itr_chr09CG04770 [Ipomoea trifida]GMD33501.1 hypothetical protein Iba_chr09cCG3180 [Ipomoea batatas]GMD49410.1 hypothetical protein Iba_scaffold46756CG0340 [Ipomoea batatas]